MPLGREVGLGPGDTVRWGPSSAMERGTAAAPSFWLMSIVAKRLPVSATSVILVLFRLQACGYTSDPRRVATRVGSIRGQQQQPLY